jgi:hypothetical protein
MVYELKSLAATVEELRARVELKTPDREPDTGSTKAARIRGANRRRTGNRETSDCRLFCFA